MAFTTRIKQIIYPLYIYWKLTTKQKLQNLDVVDLNNLKIFSNRNEDGIIFNLIKILNIEKGFFVDIGSNDCINSNCANLALNLNWEGIFIDADEKLLKIGKRNYNLFKNKAYLKFFKSFVTKENINQIIQNNINNAEIDFMSIDIDGNDFEIWKAINLKPKIVVIENKIEYGKYDIVVPVSNSFLPSEWGASIISFTNLSEAKGYSLVATNNAGFNAFYVRNDLLHFFNIKKLSLQEIFDNNIINADFYSEEKMNDLINRI